MRTLALLHALVPWFGSFCADVTAQEFPRAAVLEHADRWTEGATGTAFLLQQSGFEIEELTAASLARVDLVAFGSFTNNDEPYRQFLAEHTKALQAFVKAGGVVLELAQSDQYGNRASYLPKGCEVRRGDRDEAFVRAALPDHPLAAWLDGDRPTSVAMFGGHEMSWETLESWTGGQVVVTAGSRESFAAIVEVPHGDGRFVISSLWFDKLERDGVGLAPEPHRRASSRFGESLHDYVQLVKSGNPPTVNPTLPPPTFSVGPMVGHVDATAAHVWLRPKTEGRYVLQVDGGGETHRAEAEATAENDRCVQFRVQGLSPGQEYRYRISDAEGVPVAGGRHCRFETAPRPASRSEVTLAFGSCAKSEASSIWSAMALRDIDGLVLMGDTPYVDTTDLTLAREKHRAFLELPGLAQVIRSTPTWGTWDDHDFGRNDSDGRMPGKERTRRAFVDYRALASYGDGENGIYTSFRRGPIEVFLIDPRWFARTETVAPDDERPSLLGAAQWAWLEKGLVASTATFKILANGMVWDDKQNSESDDWGSYDYERERLEHFIGAKSISGVVLLGGDIHVSRHLSYPGTAARVGYVLDQLIVSPLHSRVIPSLNVPHPDLIWSAEEPHVFLTLTASTLGAEPKLTARWIQDIGRGAGQVLREVSWTAKQLEK